MSGIHFIKMLIITLPDFQNTSSNSLDSSTTATTVNRKIVINVPQLSEEEQTQYVKMNPKARASSLEWKTTKLRDENKLAGVQNLTFTQSPPGKDVYKSGVFFLTILGYSWYFFQYPYFKKQRVADQALIYHFTHRGGDCIETQRDFHPIIFTK